jgi:uncharacterized membrane protein
MFKRLFWLVVGASFGFGASYWLSRAVKQTMERYAPEKVTSELTQAIRGFGQDLRVAVADGRHAMREREAVLRTELDRKPRSFIVPRTREASIPLRAELESRPGS